MLGDTAALWLNFGAALSLGAVFLPLFSTPEHGDWYLWNYHFLFREGIWILYAVPVLSALIASFSKFLFPLLSLRLGTLVLRIILLLFTIVGSVGCYLLYTRILLYLFFDAIVPVSNSTGFYVLVASNGVAILGTLLLLLDSFQTKPIKKPQKKGKGSKNSSASATVPASSTLRQRKKISTQQSSSPSIPPSSASHSSTFSLLRSILLLSSFIFILLASAGGFYYFNLTISPFVWDTTSTTQAFHYPDSRFHTAIYATGITGARSLAILRCKNSHPGYDSPDSPLLLIFVGTRTEGHSRVYALVANEQRIFTKIIFEENQMAMPNGIEVDERTGALYLAEISKLWRYDAMEDQIFSKLHTSEKSSDSFVRLVLSKTLVRNDWPSDTHHGWKYLRFSPDGKYLYVPIGAPCNVCERPEDERYATIMRINVSRSLEEYKKLGGDEIYAYGIRNSVGFDFHPITHALWFTENGRDFASEEYPPDELNTAEVAGLHFGYPYCFGENVKDPETNKGRDCNQYRASTKELGPHVAAIGMRFYPPSDSYKVMFPEKYRNAIFVAEHGSWNRKKPLGYRIMVAFLNDAGDHVESYQEFMTGFLSFPDNKSRAIVHGRPADVEVFPDGSLLVSDDFSGTLYRVTYA